MTRKEAIENHRKMWNWIADETERKKKIVSKSEYFRSIRLGLSQADEVPLNHCYCCEYASSSTVEERCEACPLKWSERHPNHCASTGSPYREWYPLVSRSKWSNEHNWKKAAECAREIANLPEREDVQDERVGIPEDSES